MNIAFLAAHWPLFLASAIISIMIAFVLQLRNISNVASIDFSFFGLMKNFGPVFLFGLLAIISGLLSMVGLLASIR